MFIIPEKMASFCIKHASLYVRASGFLIKILAWTKFAQGKATLFLTALETVTLLCLKCQHPCSTA